MQFMTQSQVLAKLKPDADHAEEDIIEEELEPEGDSEWRSNLDRTISDNSMIGINSNRNKHRREVSDQIMAYRNNVNDYTNSPYEEEKVFNGRG